MPWILDTKYLFYNTDMLKKAGIAAPPKTWDELLEQAKIIKDKGIVEFPIVWSWAQAEAVICDYTMLLAVLWRRVPRPTTASRPSRPAAASRHSITW